MKTNRFLLLVGVVLSFGGSLGAAPLTWFPGPALYDPVSGAAAVISGGNNFLVGGDSYYAPDYSYALSLAATNTYWSTLGLIYSVNIAPGAVVSDGNIVLYGGRDGTGSQSAVTAINLTGDTPPTLHAMNVARSYLGYAPDRNGNAYAIGGLDAGGNPLASVERFNPVNNGAWTFVTSLPAARFAFPAVFNHTNYIYIFGGLTDTVSGVESASVLRYSVSGNSWSNLASMPVAVAGSAATLGPDGKIYVVGGTSGGVATDVVQVYDPTANSWTLSTPLPQPLSLAAASLDSLGRLIVMGGKDVNGNDVSDVWRSQPLNAPDVAPVFTQFPGTNAAYLVPYVSSITATGSPPPTYSLVSGPNGMQVDLYSGAITWTPQASQIGTNIVTIQAANYAGVTNWSYNLVIAHPPPALVTNLAVVSVTENSVTLSWSPEDPVAGPVTYSVWLRHVLHDPKGSGATIWYTQIGSSTTETNITISGLAAGLGQTYYIVATGAGGKSGYAGISATTLPAPPPTNLRVTGLTSTTITLAWDAPVGPVPVVSYRIIGVFDGVFVQYPLNFLNISNTTVTLTGLSPGRAILWGVCAYDVYGNLSSYCYLPSLAINPVPAPAALSSVSATPPGGGFTFSVQPSSFETTLIQATTTPGDPASWLTIATNPPTSGPITFTDAAASQFPMRFYRVVSP